MEYMLGIGTAVVVIVSVCAIIDWLINRFF